jgi:predicted ATP-dependent endonuclease of OLD family
MIKIKSFEIQAYRSCKKANLAFHPEFTALIGVNGSGKSNLLNSVLLLKKIFLPRPIHVPNFAYTNKSKFQAEMDYDGKIIELYGAIFFDNEERNNDDIIGVNLKWNFSSIVQGAEEIEFSPSFPFNYQEFRDKPFSRELLQSSGYVDDLGAFKRYEKRQSDQIVKAYPYIKKIIEFFQSISYYSASQFADPSKSPNFIELEDEMPLRRRRNSSSHDRYIRDLYLTWRARNTDTNYQNYLDIVNKNGIGLLDDISFNEVKMPSNSYEVFSGGNVKTVEKGRTIIAPIFNIDKNKLSPNQLSEGTLRALALIYYILTDQSRLLLLEEPEVCVHHGLLNSIIELLKRQSKKKQIVISTHSDYILDQLNPENIILVKREPNMGTISQSLTDTMKKNDFEALKIYLKESGNLGEYWKEGGLDS